MSTCMYIPTVSLVGCYLHACMGLCSDVSSCREEESLVDMFVIEMLVVMIHSLKMAHRDEKALGEFTYNHEHHVSRRRLM